MELILALFTLKLQGLSVPFVSPTEKAITRTCLYQRDNRERNYALLFTGL